MITIQDLCGVEVRLLVRVERRFSLARSSHICLKAFANGRVSKVKHFQMNVRAHAEKYAMRLWLLTVAPAHMAAPLRRSSRRLL